MSDPRRTLVIGIPVYDQVDLLDVAAPCEVFNWMAQAVADRCTVTVHVLAKRAGKVCTRAGLPIVPTATFDQVPALDVLWVPGGSPPQLKARMEDEDFLQQLRLWAGGAQYVTSVCEGAMLLAAAGLLDGYRATTHWAFVPCLAQYPNIHVVGGPDCWPRYVVDPPTPAGSGTRVTGGGVSSGLDEALKMVELLFDRATAEGVQVNIQYFPDPPVAGSITPMTSCLLDSVTAQEQPCP
jgi:transcriptional regulator GlxA family with amidase domain